MIDLIICHNNVCHLIREFSEGTNKWLLRILADIDSTIDIPGIQKGLDSHLRDVYNLQRHYGVTKQTFNEFISSPATGKRGIAFVLRSIQSHNEDIFLPAAAALKIVLERKEFDYEKFIKQMNSSDHVFMLMAFV